MNTKKNNIKISDCLDWIWSVRMDHYKQHCIIRDIKYPDKLTCKKLSELLHVTPATISNLSLDSKFSLLRSVAEEIYLYYEDFFMYDTYENSKNPCDDGSYLIWSILEVLDYITTYGVQYS